MRTPGRGVAEWLVGLTVLAVGLGLCRLLPPDPPAAPAAPLQPEPPPAPPAPPVYRYLGVG